MDQTFDKNSDQSDTGWTEQTAASRKQHQINSAGSIETGRGIFQRLH